MREALIIANGEVPCTKKILALSKNKIILALDGGYHHAKNPALKIDYLLGDFDSLTEKDIETAHKNHINVIHTPDQNATDLDKGLTFLNQFGLETIHVLAATGNRLDHTLHNLALLNKHYQKNRKLYLHTHNEIIFLMRDESITYTGNKGDGFAIFGAPNCIASTQGLVYELNNLTLNYGENSSACNTLAQNDIKITIDDSALIIHEAH